MMQKQKPIKANIQLMINITINNKQQHEIDTHGLKNLKWGRKDGIFALHAINTP